ncbi:MAG: carboxypeptidase [Bdellovibrionales bacterium]
MVPRISADGAECVLSSGVWVRSTNTPYPGEEPRENFVVKDLDGDGEVLTMRVKDPSGAYKVSPEDPRLMILREPTDFLEEQGPFYHLFPEGEFRNFDGFTKKFENPYRFDLNRQAPALFSPREYGAGPLPLYLKEAQALAKAFVERSNIVGVHTHHTFGGFLLRPSSSRPDTEFSTLDLEIYKLIGKVGESITGYKPLSVYHDFKYDPKSVTTGAWDDWHYDHRGVFSWTTEIWSLAHQAGVKKEKALEIYQNPTAQELLSFIKWCETHLNPSDYFKPWVSYQHPQLGAVEIGGWRTLYTWRNPPLKFLKTELEKLTEFTLQQAQMSPMVHVKDISVSSLGAQLYQLKVVVQNTGFLPTYVSEMAKSLKVYASPMVNLKLDSKQKLIEGKEQATTNHLSGRAEAWPWVSPVWSHDVSNTHESQFCWVLQGSGKVEFEAKYGTGGTVRAKVDIQ